MLHRIRVLASGLLYSVLAIAIVAFSVSNREKVAFSLYPFPFDIELPKYFFLLIVFIAGAAVGATLSGKRFLARRREFRRKEAQIAALENEIAALRAERGSLPPPSA